MLAVNAHKTTISNAMERLLMLWLSACFLRRFISVFPFAVLHMYFFTFLFRLLTFVYAILLALPQSGI